MTTYERIRQIRNEKFPPELEFGCEVIPKLAGNHGLRRITERVSWTDEIRIERVGEVLKKGQYENLGLPVSLNDVLRMVGDNIDEDDCLLSSDFIRLFKNYVSIDIDLSKSIKDQEEEVLVEILKLIK